MNKQHIEIRVWDLYKPHSAPPVVITGHVEYDDSLDAEQLAALVYSMERRMNEQNDIMGATPLRTHITIEEYGK